MFLILFIWLFRVICIFILHITLPYFTLLNVNDFLEANLSASPQGIPISTYSFIESLSISQTCETEPRPGYAYDGSPVCAD